MFIKKIMERSTVNENISFFHQKEIGSYTRAGFISERLYPLSESLQKQYHKTGRSDLCQNVCSTGYTKIRGYQKDVFKSFGFVWHQDTYTADSVLQECCCGEVRTATLQIFHCVSRSGQY